MELLNYLNQNEDWEKKLSNDPYFFKIEKCDNYVFIAADMNKSSRSNILAREAHGTIFRKENDRYICVNYSFPHVYSFEEADSTSFDWKNAETYSHIDGLMVCAWNDNGKWHFSTDEHFNIKDVIGNNQYTGYDLLKDACNGKITNLTTNLAPDYCYTFILTSPNYKLIADYGNKTQLWYITKRNIFTLVEDGYAPKFDLPIQMPHHFDYLRVPRLLSELRKVVTKDEVGYICVDKNWNRIKIDGDAYTEKRAIRGSQTLITPQHIVELWQKNELDNYAEEFGDDNNIILIKNCLQTIIDNADSSFDKLIEISKKDRKTFMRKLPRYLPCTRAYYTERWFGAEPHAEEYFKKAPIKDVMADLQYEIMQRRQR